MNVLLINHYAGSPQYGMEFRPYYMARQWAAAGHQVSILAASQSHLRVRTPRVHGLITRETVEHIPYIWLKTPKYSGNGIRRAINMGVFVISGSIHAKQLAREVRPDVVIASSTYPLDIIIAERIARHSGAAIVYEVHDLWPLSPIELGGMSRRHPFIRIMQWAEDRAYRCASRVVSMLPKSLEHMVNRGMHPEKFAYVPNGIAEDEWNASTDPLPALHQEALESLKNSGRLIVGYAGAHGRANALETILEAAALLELRPVVFVFVGDGPEKGHLQATANQRQLRNILFLPPVPKGSIPQLLQRFDVCCITLQRQPLFRFGISPNKLMDYMMAGRPILHAVKAANDLVRESGSGVSIDAENPRALAEGVEQFLAMNAQERSALGLRGREYVQSRHSYSALASHFLSVLHAAVAERRGLSGFLQP